MALCVHKVICHRREAVAPAWVSGLIEGTSLSSPITSFQQKKEVHGKLHEREKSRMRRSLN